VKQQTVVLFAAICCEIPLSHPIPIIKLLRERLGSIQTVTVCNANKEINSRSLYGARWVLACEYYDTFSSVGIQNTAHLLALTMQDYPTLGITSMQDRRQMFHLIQNVKEKENLTRPSLSTGTHPYTTINYVDNIYQGGKACCIICLGETPE